MLSKFIDIYVGIGGVLGLALALGVVLITLYRLSVRKSFIALLIFMGFLALFYLKTTGYILLLAALAVIFANNFIFYVYFIIRACNRKHQTSENTITEYPSISILIPAKNEANVIKETLISVSQLDYPPSKFEVIVIDDGSTDQTYDLVTSLTNIQNLKVVRHQTSHGKANSINEIVQETTSEYVLILDADHLIDKNFLKRALPLFNSPDIICVQGKNLVRNGNTSLLSQLVELEYQERYELIIKGRSTPFFMGSAGIFRVELLKEIGGFDPVMLTEDYELSHRVYLKGYRIIFDPSLKTYELAPVDFKNYFIQRHRWFRGLWQILHCHFKSFVKSKKVSLPAKMVIFHNYIEAMALFCYLFLSILCALDLFKVIRLDYKYFAYILLLSPILLYILAITIYKKPGLYLFLPFIPCYYVLFAIPNFMAMIDNWILKSEYKWNKTNRLTPIDPFSAQMEKEVVAVKYSETQ